MSNLIPKAKRKSVQGGVTISHLLLSFVSIISFLMKSKLEVKLEVNSYNLKIYFSFY